MEFHFSIRDTIKRAWHEFRANLMLFVVLISGEVLIQFLAPDSIRPHPLTIVLTIVMCVWYVVILKLTLRVARGETLTPSFALIQETLPSFKEFFMFLGVSILTSLCYGVGFILLVIPGIYLMARLVFSNIVYLDQHTSVIGALKTSWRLTKGPILWTSILVIISFVLLMLVGAAFFRIGLYITMPLALLLLMHFYTAVVAYQNAGPRVVKEIEVVE